MLTLINYFNELIVGKGLENRLQSAPLADSAFPHEFAYIYIEKRD
jgi:hypothetical protein